MFKTTFKSEDGNCSFSFNNYKGSKSFSIFKEGVRTPIKIRLDLGFYAVARRLFNKIAQAGPGAREYTYIKEWDQQAKKFEIKKTFTVGIKDTGLYYFEIAEHDRPPMVFPIKGSSNYTNGSDDFSASEKSKLAFIAVVDLFNSGAIFDIPEPQPFNKDGGGNNNYNKSSGSESSYSKNDDSF